MAALEKRIVLIVDDEWSVTRSIAEIARTEGYTVIEAESGAEALEKAAGAQGKIDLLVTDLIMPGMTGRVLADFLKAVNPALKIIFMSGYIRDSLALDEGTEYEFIQKPSEPVRLVALMRTIMKK